MLESYGPDVLLHGCPSSVDWVYDDPNHMAVAFVSSACGIYDVETGKQVIQFDTSSQVIDVSLYQAKTDNLMRYINANS